ncbi:hypothetical protein FAES_pFAES01059 (plasmid) [Fibrella aestuarina BUZ 2]|uniref:Uncharacterized protein n=1 Tax=Fibrella aestuarina BUZ 2 TaxID=1166018 RepID=I0KHF0_9BACT|nr:hypothetical protein [Fibrella aestuarina]CCH03553.1 hypothetical protein FAES_pFAES01059 [Fibrella aestuarina BUZ 2]
MNHYHNNLLIRHKHMLLISTTGLTLLALVVVGSIVWSFGLYRQATQNTYVFHQKGAAVAIYDERIQQPISISHTAKTDRDTQ